jgi:lipopolysaccharide biosynthesis glycosyltransferase
MVEKAEKPVINLGFCFDKDYLSPFYVTLTSVFHHNKAYTVVIHAIATGVSPKDKEKLSLFVLANGGQIFFHTVDGESLHGLVLPEGGHLTLATYYRLFFATLVPKDVKSIIYIDIDTVVVGELFTLSQIDTNLHPIAAVPDDWMPIREELGIYQKGEYFNAGITLINISRWKEKKVTERALEAVRTSPKEFFKFADQDALNMVLKDDWHKLPPAYNLTGVHCPTTTNRKILEEFLHDKRIIHYSGPKPWNILTECTHVYRYKWFEYFELSPVKSFIKYFDVSFSQAFLKKYTRGKLLKTYLSIPLLGTIKRMVLPKST